MPGTFPDPEISPDEAPLVSASWNDAWTPFIVGACERLLNINLWEVLPEDWEVLQSRIYTLITILSIPNALPSFHVLYEGDPDYADEIDDTSPVNLGMRFTVSEAGFIHAVRLWKRETDGTGQTGYLWTNTGDLLGSADFPDEGLGWIEAPFETPIAMEASTTYVIAVHSPSGHFVRTFGAMAVEVSNPPITAIADGVDGFTGTYAYGSAGIFPTNDGFANNYFLDFRFAT